MFPVKLPLVLLVSNPMITSGSGSYTPTNPPESKSTIEVGSVYSPAHWSCVIVLRELITLRRLDAGI